MPGLSTSLFISVQALMAEQGALNVTTNNIANVNTPGYTREVAILNEAPTFKEGNVQFGGGRPHAEFQERAESVAAIRDVRRTEEQKKSPTQMGLVAADQSVFS